MQPEKLQLLFIFWFTSYLYMPYKSWNL